MGSSSLDGPAEGKMAEIELQLLQLDQDLRTETQKEIGEIRAKVAELTERRTAAEDQVRRVEIRAPTAGYVHQLATHTVGGVISAAGRSCRSFPRATS